VPRGAADIAVHCADLGGNNHQEYTVFKLLSRKIVTSLPLLEWSRDVARWWVGVARSSEASKANSRLGLGAFPGMELR
jgi:hypothetical protein